MFNRLRVWLRDWRRGYTDADRESASLKIKGTPPGAFVEVTEAEWRATVANPMTEEPARWMTVGGRKFWL